MYELVVEIQTAIGKEKLTFIGGKRVSTVNSDIASFDPLSPVEPA